MWLLGYDGMRESTDFRHPEQLVQMAPQYLQDACARIGGRNLAGKPNFRVVVVGSRYMIAGGHDFTFHDNHGNVQMVRPAEMLVPRYPATKEEIGCYALERWHSPEWYYKNSYAGRADDVDYSADGKATRRVEPIWPEGGYEACWWEPQQLFILPHDIPIHSDVGPSLSWAIHMVERTAEVDPAKVLEAVAAKREKEKEQEVSENADIYKERGRADLFLDAGVSYAGINAKEDLWPTKKESSVSEPGTF